MTRTKGEGRSASEKSGRLIEPAAVRRARLNARRREEEEWAARAGEVTVRRVDGQA